jgi:hypothetical protein
VTIYKVKSVDRGINITKKKKKKKQNPKLFSSTLEIQKLEMPTSWRVLKKNTRKETPSACEEAVFVLQGIIVSKDLPPLREKPR